MILHKQTLAEENRHRYLATRPALCLEGYPPSLPLTLPNCSLGELAAALGL